MTTPKDSYLARQTRRLSRGEINRRRFVMSALATGVSMPTAMSLAGRAEAMAPKRGGTFRMALAEGLTGDTLDPALAAHDFAATMVNARGNHLTEIDARGRAVPDLAESLESDDDVRWHVRLRRGVTFHNGKTLSTGDVVASLNHHRARGLLPAIERIRADSETSLLIDLAEPDPDFLRRLADERLMIMSARDGAVDPEDALNGTGGYVLTDFEPGRRAIFRRNPDYWKEGCAHFDAFELVSIPDASARQAAVMTGEVDYASDIDPRTVALLNRAPTLAITQTEAARPCAFVARPGTSISGNRDLWLALGHAIDRQDLVNRILLGHGRPGPNTTNTPACDPERAATLYRRSGHTGPIRLGIGPDAFPGASETARRIAASARQAGIEMVLAEPCDTAAADLRAASWTERLSTAHLVPMIANHIAAHSRALAHPAHRQPGRANDGLKAHERWWFA